MRDMYDETDSAYQPKFDIYTATASPSSPSPADFWHRRFGVIATAESTTIFGGSQTIRHCKQVDSYCSCSNRHCLVNLATQMSSTDESEYQYLNQCASNRSEHQVLESQQRTPRLNHELATASANNRLCHQGPVISMLQCLHPAESRRTHSCDSGSSGRRHKRRQIQHHRGHSRSSGIQRVQDCAAGGQSALKIVFDNDCSRSPVCCVLKRDGQSSSEEDSTEGCCTAYASPATQKGCCYNESSDDEVSDCRSPCGVVPHDSRSTASCSCCCYCCCCCSRQRDKPCEQPRRHLLTPQPKRDHRGVTTCGRGPRTADCRTSCYESSVCHSRRVACAADCPASPQIPRHRHQVDVYTTCCHPGDSLAYMERSDEVRRSRRYDHQRIQHEQSRRLRREGAEHGRRHSGDVTWPRQREPDTDRDRDGAKLPAATDVSPVKDFKKGSNYYEFQADEESMWTNSPVAEKSGPDEQLKVAADCAGQTYVLQRDSDLYVPLRHGEMAAPHGQVDSRLEAGVPHDERKASKSAYHGDRFKDIKHRTSSHRCADRSYIPRSKLAHFDPSRDKELNGGLAKRPSALTENEQGYEYGVWTDKVTVGKYTALTKTDRTESTKEKSEKTNTEKLDPGNGQFEHLKRSSQSSTDGLVRRDSLRARHERQSVKSFKQEEDRAESLNDGYKEKTGKYPTRSDKYGDKLFLGWGNEGPSFKGQYNTTELKIEGHKTESSTPIQPSREKFDSKTSEEDMTAQDVQKSEPTTHQGSVDRELQPVIEPAPGTQMAVIGKQTLLEDKSRDALSSDSEEYQQMEARSGARRDQEEHQERVVQPDADVSTLDGAGQAQQHEKQSTIEAKVKPTDLPTETQVTDQSKEKAVIDDQLDAKSPTREPAAEKALPDAEKNVAVEVSTSHDGNESVSDISKQQKIEEKVENPEEDSGKSTTLKAEEVAGLEVSETQVVETETDAEKQRLSQERDVSHEPKQPDVSIDENPSPDESAPKPELPVIDSVPDDADQLSSQPIDSGISETPVQPEPMHKPDEQRDYIPPSSTTAPTKLYYPPGAEHRRRSQQQDTGLSQIGTPLGTCDRPFLPPGAVVEKSPDPDFSARKHRGSVTSEGSGPIFPPGAVARRTSQLSTGSDGSRKLRATERNEGFIKATTAKLGMPTAERRWSNIAEKSFRAAEEKFCDSSMEHGKLIPVIRTDEDFLKAEESLKVKETSQETYQRHSSFKFESDGSTVTLAKSEYVARRSLTESTTHYENELTDTRKSISERISESQPTNSEPNQADLQTYYLKRPTDKYSKMYTGPEGLIDKESVMIETGSRATYKEEFSGRDSDYKSGHLNQDVKTYENQPGGRIESFGEASEYAWNKSESIEKPSGYLHGEYGPESMALGHQPGPISKEQATKDRRSVEPAYTEQNFGYQARQFAKDDGGKLYQEGRKSIEKISEQLQNQPVFESDTSKLVPGSKSTKPEINPERTDFGSGKLRQDFDLTERKESQTEQLSKRTSVVYKPQLSAKDLTKLPTAVSTSDELKSVRLQEKIVNANKILYQNAKQSLTDSGLTETPQPSGLQIPEGLTAYIPGKHAFQNKSVYQAVQPAPNSEPTDSAAEFRLDQGLSIDNSDTVEQNQPPEFQHKRLSAKEINQGHPTASGVPDSKQGYQHSPMDVESRRGYQPNLQAPESRYQQPIHQDPRQDYQNIQRASDSGYQEPAPHDPGQSYNPTVQQGPAQGYNPPVQQGPAQGYNLPVQRGPAQGYNPTVQQSPAQGYNPPVEQDPGQGYKLPAPQSSGQGYNEIVQQDPGNGYEQPVQRASDSGYQQSVQQSVGQGYGAIKQAPEFRLQETIQLVPDQGYKRSLLQIPEQGNLPFQQIPESNYQQPVLEKATERDNPPNKQTIESGYLKTVQQAQDAGYQQVVQKAPVTGYQEPVQQTSDTGYQKADQKAPDTGYHQPVQQEADTGYQQAAQKAPDTGYHQPVQQETDTGYQQAAQKAPDTGYHQPVRPETDTGYQQAAQKAPDTGYHQSVRPETDTGYQQAAQKAPDTGYHQSVRPETDTGYQQAAQKAPDTGYHQSVQQETDTGYQQAAQKAPDTGYHQPVQQETDTGYQQAAQKAPDTGYHHPVQQAPKQADLSDQEATKSGYEPDSKTRKSSTESKSEQPEPIKRPSYGRLPERKQENLPPVSAVDIQRLESDEPTLKAVDDAEYQPRQRIHSSAMEEKNPREEKLTSPTTDMRDRADVSGGTESRWGTPSAAELRAPDSTSYTQGRMDDIAPPEQKIGLYPESESKDELQRSTTTIESSVTDSRNQGLASSESRTPFPASTDSRTDVAPSSESTTQLADSLGTKSEALSSSESKTYPTISHDEKTDATVDQGIENGFDNQAQIGAEKVADPEERVDNRFGMPPEIGISADLHKKATIATDEPSSSLFEAEKINETSATIPAAAANLSDLPQTAERVIIKPSERAESQSTHRTDYRKSPPLGAEQGRTGLPTGTEGRTGLPTGTEGRTGLPTGTEGRTGLPTGTEGRTGLPTGTEGRTGLPTGTEGRTGLLTGTEGRTGLPTGTEGRTSLLTGTEGRTSLLTGTEGRTGLPTGTEGRTGLPTGTEGRTGLPPGTESRLNLLPGAESRASLSTGAESSSGLFQPEDSRTGIPQENQRRKSLPYAADNKVNLPRLPIQDSLDTTLHPATDSSTGEPLSLPRADDNVTSISPEARTWTGAEPGDDSKTNLPLGSERRTAGTSLTENRNDPTSSGQQPGADSLSSTSLDDSRTFQPTEVHQRADFGIGTAKTRIPPGMESSTDVHAYGVGKSTALPAEGNSRSGLPQRSERRMSLQNKPNADGLADQNDKRTGKFPGSEYEAGALPGYESLSQQLPSDERRTSDVSGTDGRFHRTPGAESKTTISAGVDSRPEVPHGFESASGFSPRPEESRFPKNAYFPPATDDTSGNMPRLDGSTAFSTSTDSKTGFVPYLQSQPVLKDAAEIKANSPIKQLESLSPESEKQSYTPSSALEKTGPSFGSQDASGFHPRPYGSIGLSSSIEESERTPVSATDNRTGYVSELDSATGMSQTTSDVQPTHRPVQADRNRLETYPDSERAGSGPTLTKDSQSQPTIDYDSRMSGIRSTAPTASDQSLDFRPRRSYTDEGSGKQLSDVDETQPSSSRPVLHIVSDASSRSRQTSSTSGPYGSGGSDAAEQHRLVKQDRWAKSAIADPSMQNKERAIPVEGVSRIPPLRQQLSLQPSVHRPRDQKSGSPVAHRLRAQFGTAERVLITDEETYSDSSERCFELESKPLLVGESSNANARLKAVSLSSLSGRVCTRRPYSHAVWHAVSTPVDDTTTSNSSSRSSSCSCSESDEENSPVTPQSIARGRFRRGSILTSAANSARQLRQLSSDRLSSECPVCRCLALFDEFAQHQTTRCSGNCQRFSNR